LTINGTIFNVELLDIIFDLQVQLASNGIQLLEKVVDSSKDVMVQCPYHNNGQERKPSAGIRKSDGVLHCFACNETHSLAEVISHCFGYNDNGMFGWRWLYKHYAAVEVEVRKDVQIDLARDNISHKSFVLADTIDNSDRRFVKEEELEKYRHLHPYWSKRGITNESLIELFDLGYDKDTNCITFPVRDREGNCLFVARRSVSTKYFHYPAGVKKPLYGEYEFRRVYLQTLKNLMSLEFNGIDVSEIVVCESMIDALTAWQYGKPAVALNGLGTSQQYKDLEALPVRKLILATDNDTAGMKARERIRLNVHNKIITEYILPNRKKDLNELTKNEFSLLEEVF